MNLLFKKKSSQSVFHQWMPTIVFLFFAFIYKNIIIVNGDGDRIQVQLSGGIVEGKIVKFGDREAVAFMGIPYAEAPIGDLRFKPTRSKSSWEGVWDATKYGPPCAQLTNKTIQPLEGSSEDCLHINVFADKRCLTKACPIIFYNFAIHETIIVVPSYRLGIFGFLDMGDNEDYVNAPQNAGLLDLITALRWCQQELPRLGGDPRQITLVGNSAGSHLGFILLNSPMVERTAFKRAIISSGMISIRDGQCRRLSQEVLTQIECTHNPITQATLTRRQKIECLKRKSTEQLLEAMSDSEEKWLEFSPQVDDRILVEKSVEGFWRSWKGIPLMLITTVDEYFMKNHPDVEGKCEELVENFGYSKQETIDKCVEYYTKNSHLNYTVRDAYHAFMHKLASINTQLGYETYAGVFAQPNGVKHAGDLKYLLGLHPLSEDEKDVDDLKMDKFYPMLWREFAKRGGKGISDWKPTDPQGRNYYWLRFQTNEKSSKLEDWPQMVEGEFFRPKETHFWMEELKHIDMSSPPRGNLDKDYKFGLPGILGPLHKPPPPSDSPSVWLAFWLVLGVCVVLSAALSVTIIFWITMRLHAANLVVRKVSYPD